MGSRPITRARYELVELNRQLLALYLDLMDLDDNRRVELTNAQLLITRLIQEGCR